MFIVGITGSMGCGKSTMTKKLQEKGAYTASSDQFARAALAVGSDGLNQVVTHFGAQILHKDGSLNREALRQEVFLHSQARKALEAIVHPEVRRQQIKFIQDIEKSAKTPPVIALEIPLLFETKAEKRLDYVVVVACGDQQQERLKNRPLDLSIQKKMIQSQMPEDKKCQRADFIIQNQGDMANTETQIEQLWPILQQKAEQPSQVWPQMWL
ncbi:dephospho-CoA kinase [Magnetococcales bacterium HHB-1]